MCSVDSDCVSSACDAGVCVSCSDGVQNAAETDVDCGGGTCFPCSGGLMCATGTDCYSGSCTGGTCDPGGAAILIGHDYFSSNASMDRLLGNAVLLTGETGNVEVVIYDQYSDTTSTGEATRVESIISAQVAAAGRTATITRLSDYTMLSSTLTASVDVLVIAEEESATMTQMTTVASAWNADLNTFLGRGGIVITTSYTDDAWRIVNGPGLFTISGSSFESGDQNVVLASHPLITGVTSPYAGLSGTGSFQGLTTGIVAVRDASSMEPVVVFRAY